MTERAEVEALLAEVNVYTGRKSGLIAELCRTWLAVQNAPVTPVSEQVAFDTPLDAMNWDSPCFKTTHARILRCDESGRLVRDGGE